MVQLSENLTHKFIRRGSWIYLFAFLSGPLGYAIKIMISHDVSVTDVGILYSTLSLILLVGSLNDLGMVESLHYFIPKLISEEKQEKVKAYLIYAFIAMLSTSIITSTGLYYSAGFLAESYFSASNEIKDSITAILQIFSVFLVVNNLQHYFATVAYIHQNTFLAKGIETFRLLLSTILGFTFFFGNGYTIHEYAALWNYGAIPTTVIGGIFAWKYHLKDIFYNTKFVFQKEDLIELIKYSGWALLANNAILLLSQIDIQLVMKLTGAEQAGYYSNYVSLISIPFLLVAPIISFLFPVISAYNGARQIETIKTIVRTFTRVFLLAGIAATGVIFAIGSELGTFFFSEKFEASGHILYWSIGFLVFNFLLQINFNLLAATGKVKKRLEIILYGITINLILNIILIGYAQAAGSALAVGLTWIFIWYASYRATKEFHTKIEWRIQIINLACFIALGLAGYWGIRQFGIRGGERYLFAAYTFIFSLLSLGVFIVINRRDIQNIIATLKDRKKQKE